MRSRTRVPFGMPENKTGTGFLGNAEQIQLSPEFPVIPLLGLLQLRQVVRKLVGSEECRAVNPLQLLLVLVSLPVGTCNTENMEAVGLICPVEQTCGPVQKSTRSPSW